MELVFEHYSDYRNFYINNLRDRQQKQLREFEQQLEKELQKYEQQLEKTWREQHQQKVITIQELRDAFVDKKFRDTIAQSNNEFIVYADIEHGNTTILGPVRININDEGNFKISPIQPDSK